MTVTIVLPKHYSYVVAVSLVAIPFLSFVHGTITGLKRRDAKCPYPNGYASAQEMKTNRAAYEFNCAQRAHTQFLENAPQTMISMLVAGVMYPDSTTVLGTAWLGCRILFLYGYIYSSKEQGKGRLVGSLFWLFQGGLWALVALSAWNLLQE